MAIDAASPVISSTPSLAPALSAELRDAADWLQSTSWREVFSAGAPLDTSSWPAQDRHPAAGQVQEALERVSDITHHLAPPAADREVPPEWTAELADSFRQPWRAKHIQNCSVCSLPMVVRRPHLSIVGDLASLISSVHEGLTQRRANSGQRKLPIVPQIGCLCSLHFELERRASQPEAQGCRAQ